MGTTKPKRVGIYARASTGDQDAQLQVEELRRLAVQRDWKITAEYVDEGVSGTKTSRPELDRLLADAQAGRLDVVLVWKLDRLGRSLQHLLSVLDDLQSWGVGFASARAPGIDTTAVSGRLLLQLLGAFAEFEREMIVERVTAGVRRAQASGKHCGRPKVEIDLRPALAMLREGNGLKATAGAMGVGISTLRRRLREAGEWPRREGVQEAPAGRAAITGSTT